MRDPTQLQEQEAGQSLEPGVPGQFDSVLRLQVTHAHGAFHVHVHGSAARACGALVVLVFDAPDDLFQHIFHGQQAHDGAEFVHHHRHMGPAVSELLQHL